MNDIKKGEVIYSALFDDPRGGVERYSLVKKVDRFNQNNLSLVIIAERVSGTTNIMNSDETVSAHITGFNSKDSFRMNFKNPLTAPTDSIGHIVQSDVLPNEIIPRIKTLLKTI